MVSLFGVVGLTAPKNDIEPFDGAQDKFRGFTEFGVANSVNPFNSLSYAPNHSSFRFFRIGHPDRCIMAAQNPIQANGKMIMLGHRPTR